MYGDSADGAAVSGGATSSVSGSGVVSGDQPDGAGSSDSGSAGSGESDFAGNGEPAGGAAPGVKTEAAGSKWPGYYYGSLGSTAFENSATKMGSGKHIPGPFFICDAV